MIRYVDSNSPGANHDSFIWNNNQLDATLNQRYQNGETNTWLLGEILQLIMMYIQNLSYFRFQVMLVTL